MEFVVEYGVFLAKAVSVAIIVLLLGGMLIGGAVSRVRGSKAESSSPGNLSIRHLNADFEQSAMKIDAATLPGKLQKALRKKLKATRKQRRSEKRRKIFVIDFHGDIRASATSALREEVTALLSVADPPDEVVVRLESVGGMVHSYGLAAAQLKRIRDRGIRLTVSVDKVAASGGYMMACVADRIIAAPFAILGSIGVIAAMPNFNRVLKKHDIDYEQFMAGEYKRTVTLFGENTDRERDKFQQDIEDVHALFKEFVHSHRAQVDLDKAATGEYWYGLRALDLKLTDELLTSDDYLLGASTEADLYQLRWETEKSWLERFTSESVSESVSRIFFAKSS